MYVLYILKLGKISQVEINRPLINKIFSSKKNFQELFIYILIF